MQAETFPNVAFDVWTTIADGTVVLARNTSHIPEPVSSDETPFPRSDGSWGPHEISLLPQMYDPKHPHMAHVIIKFHDYFRLPKYIISHRFSERDFYRFPFLPRRGYVKESMIILWREEIVPYHSQVSDLYHELQRLRPGSYVAPALAVTRAEHTLMYMSTPGMSYRDAVEYFRGLQRFVAEIHAFLVWGNLMLGRSLLSSPPPDQCYRGVYVSTTVDFEQVSALAVPVYYLTALIITPSLPLRQRVHIQNLGELCELRTWAEIGATGVNKDVVKGRLLHSKDLMFYPPHIDPVVPFAFERAARGYAPRLDTAHGDHRLYIDVSKVHSKGKYLSDFVGQPRKEKPRGNDWDRQISSVRAQWPVWGCDWDYMWHVVNSNNIVNNKQNPPVPVRGAHFLYTVPPVHLLSNVQSDDKRPRVFFTWICIRRIWLLRYEQYRVIQGSTIVTTPDKDAPPTPFHHFTQTWRDVLEGNWWRSKQWPSGVPYDHRTFWRYGGLQILGPSEEELRRNDEDPEDAHYSRQDDLSPLLQNDRRLELTDFTNKQLCNLVVYDLALVNNRVQFDETDDHVMHIACMTQSDRATRIAARKDLFRSSWNLPTVQMPWHDGDWRLAIPWYTRFRTLLSSWPREYDVQNIEWDKDMSDLDEWRFIQHGKLVVAFYRRTVANVLGITVAPLLRYPNVDTLDPIFFTM